MEFRERQVRLWGENLIVHRSSENPDCGDIPKICIFGNCERYHFVLTVLVSLWSVNVVYGSEWRFTVKEEKESRLMKIQVLSKRGV